MKTYTVELTATVEAYTVVEIEAESEDEARELAVEEANDPSWWDELVFSDGPEVAAVTCDDGDAE
jgi:hypothetical protein